MKRALLFFVVAIGLLNAGYAQQSQDLFSLSWGNGENELGFKELALGGVSHEKGFFTLRYGPSAIAVGQDGHIFILDRVNDRVLVLASDGKKLDSFPAPESCDGLATGPNGALVAFSPVAKFAVGIKGPLAGKRMDAPEHFAALSEVWFVKDQLWGRYGWQAARLDDPEQRNVVDFARSVVNGKNRIAIGICRNRTGDTCIVLALNGVISNSYATGQVLTGNRIAVTVERPIQERKRTRSILICDEQGNATSPVVLAPAWTDCFSPYWVTPQGIIYEMVITRTGVTVRCWSEAKNTRNLKLRQVPYREVIPQNKMQQSSRRSVNVWFRGSNTVKTVELEGYIKGVVSQEVYSWFELEAHKSMAVAARTYAVARYRHPEKSPKAHVCDSTCCQAWTANPTPRAIQAVDATAGEYIKRGSSVISEPLYFSHCNGRTRNSEDYDSWNSINYLRSKSCACGYTSYFGHGVGMCQYGMNAYASQHGWNYVQIIEHYYDGCTVGR